jgi:hypothetical protein
MRDGSLCVRVTQVLGGSVEYVIHRHLSARRRWQRWTTSRGLILVRRLGYVVSTALDLAVAGHAEVNRLLRKEPQVRLTVHPPFAVQNNSWKQLQFVKRERDTIPKPFGLETPST